MTSFKVKTLNDLDRVALEILSLLQKGSAIGLLGPLGVGKTTLVRSLIKAIASQNKINIPRVLSPTYSIQQSFPELTPRIEHFDLYRLLPLDEKKLLEIGYQEALEQTQKEKGLLFVEWADPALKKNLLNISMWIELKFSEENRVIEVSKGANKL